MGARYRPQPRPPQTPANDGPRNPSQAPIGVATSSHVSPPWWRTPPERLERRSVHSLGTFPVAGADLDYDVRGDGPCVIFVHGTGTHRLTFEPVLEALADGHALVTYDRRGFGRSRGALAGRMGQHADDLAALVRQVSHGPATIVAQSGGAIVALQLAASHPELVQHLILAEPVVQLARVPSFSVTTAVCGLHARRALGRKEEAATGFYRWASGRSDGTSSWDTVPEQWKDIALQHADAVFREIRQMTVPIPSSRSIRSVSSPATVVIGDIGQAVFHRTTRRVARLLPRSEMVTVADSGHLLAIDQPAAFAEVVADVLTN